VASLQSSFPTLSTPSQALLFGLDAAHFCLESSALAPKVGHRYTGSTAKGCEQNFEKKTSLPIKEVKPSFNTPRYDASSKRPRYKIKVSKIMRCRDVD
jgi:hypothetical protein